MIHSNISVLHISTFDSLGGAGRSACRIHSSLKSCGVTSRMLVGWKYKQDTDIGVVHDKRGLYLLDRLTHRMTNFLGLQYLFFPSSFLLPLHQWYSKANIIQLYNTHGGYFSHMVLPWLSKSKPVIWRLSDMWPMTGHCAYAYECESWKTGCLSCPRLEEDPPLRRDTANLLWRVKRLCYNNSRLTIVAPSKWILKLAKESPLLNRFPMHLIPNSVDTSVFKETPREIARTKLQIPKDKKVILFCAHGRGLEDFRKGGSFLTRSLDRLSIQKSEVTLLVLGTSSDTREVTYGFQVMHLGHIVNNDRMIALAYSAADVYVTPTLAENLPNAILESMACGTPVVAFKVGGIPEVVRHMETGYLAEPRDSRDLANGIDVLLGNSNRFQMSLRCREMVEKEYALDIESRRFIQLYDETLTGCCEHK